MRAAVAAALQERQVLGVLDRGRLREALNRLRQQVREIGDFDALGISGSVSGARACSGMNDRLLVLTCCHSNDFFEP